MLSLVLLWLVVGGALIALFLLTQLSGAEGRFSRSGVGRGLWLAIGLVLAAPVVYVFEQQFYESFAVLLNLTGRLLTELLPRVVGMAEGVAAGSPRLQSLLYVLFAFGVTAVLTAVLVAATIVGSRVVIQAVAALAIPYAVMYWLATHPETPRYLLDLILAGYTGALFFGVVFPLLWRGVEPLLAPTVATAEFRRLRAIIYGARSRFAQLLYLVLGVLGLVGAIGRVDVVPIAPSTGTVAAARPGAPIMAHLDTPRPDSSRPDSSKDGRRQFTVRQGEEVATGIVLASQQELAIESTGEAIVQFAPGQRVSLERTIGTGDDPGLCPLPLGEPQSSARCSRYRAGSPHGGEVILIGATRSGGPPTTVTITGPLPRTSGYRWLGAGEIVPMRIDSQPYYCAGPGLSVVRPGDTEKRSPLKSILSCSHNPNKVWPELSRGDVEIRAGEQMTWFGGVNSDRHFASR